nr:Bax inhibitor-1/YccA family protein [Vallitalea okinawensis]
MLDMQLEQSRFMTKVYGWMTLGLLITAITALFTVYTSVFDFVFYNQFTFIGILIGEIALVIYLTRRIHKMNPATAVTLFLVYSAVNGLTISAYFLVYTTGSIVSTFMITAVTFGIMSVYGLVTKTDLTKLGNLFLMGLVGFIIASVVNIFLQSEALYWIATYVGIIIFIGLIAYDTQKIKTYYFASTTATGEHTKASIMGALSLYLDFINLFLLLLRMFGRRR